MERIVKGRHAKIISTFYLDYKSKLTASLTGSTIKAMFKNNPHDADADALLTKLIGTGITITGTDYICETLLTGAETVLFYNNKIYFEIVAKLAEGTLISEGVEELNVVPNLLKTVF